MDTARIERGNPCGYHSRLLVVSHPRRTALTNLHVLDIPLVSLSGSTLLEFK
jgi:hypothetical protein